LTAPGTPQLDPSGAPSEIRTWTLGAYPSVGAPASYVASGPAITVEDGPVEVIEKAPVLSLLERLIGTASYDRTVAERECLALLKANGRLA
jgi:hypothetical protein